MKLTLTFGFLLCHQAAGTGLRQTVDHFRNIDAAPGLNTKQNAAGFGSLLDALEQEEKQLEMEEASLLELVQAMEAMNSGMSLIPTASPSLQPSDNATDGTLAPTVEMTENPSNSSVSTAVPTFAITDSPSNSSAPTSLPTFAITDSPSNSSAPSVSPAPMPTVPITPLPTVSAAPSAAPTLVKCGITPEERIAAIMASLDQVANSTLIRDISTPQGRATEFIISEDSRRLCPGDINIIQRWVLAVMYYSTAGDSWLQCFGGDAGCGDFVPFVGEVAFLGPEIECKWAGISCSSSAIVTEIEFEENNLDGTIPTELGLLSDLVIWGMEQGNLTGNIPSEIGRLEKLIFIDLDFNGLTGTLPTSLYNLVHLTQLDLNNNMLSGNVAGLGVFTDLEFLQLHSNLFTGTIPDSVGSFPGLGTFTLHETAFTGTVPTGLCELVDSGILTSLIADCGADVPEITCECCTDCRIIPL